MKKPVTKKSIVLCLLCLSAALPLLAGCHSNAAASTDNTSKADQKKMMQGDPSKMPPGLTEKYMKQGPPPAPAKP